MDANTNQTTEYPGVEENLSGYFQRSATTVRQIERDYARPVSRYASLKFKENPIKMTFLSIFAGLSALPLLSFIGLTVFTFSSLVFLAVISSAIVFIIVEAVFVVCLVFMLWSLFIVACFTTVIAVFVYWTTRLGVLVTYEGPSGVTDWAHETQRRFFYPKRREATEESDESAVLVDQDGQSPQKLKVEEETPLHD
ncbi:hypothetical protein JVT61DRAFT_8281 [Boletus reticuloceps]|uniref:Promethin n=1 Tax=Boletus reticuloceps TaxID=495285 RepID=A0A8I2YY19_9AGAM|nr:hypothetical protein JVT61DRAFT_8281 [Boletus reticuloceps]